MLFTASFRCIFKKIFYQLYLELLNWKNGSVSGERHASLAGVAGNHPARMLYGSKRQASGWQVGVAMQDAHLAASV